jgi:ATP-dependent DNA helicase RecG
VIKIFDSIDGISGIGPKRLQALHNLGIFNVNDMLTYYPSRYEDISSQLPSQTENGAKVAFQGTISSLPKVRFLGSKRSMTDFGLLVEHDNIRVTFFNQPWVVKNRQIGDTVAVFGTYDKNRQSLSATKVLTDIDDSDIQVIHPVSKDINQKTLTQLIENTYAKYRNDIVDIVPKHIVSQYGLMNRKEMIESMQFPKTKFQANQATKSAMFEEFFLFQMRIQLLKYQQRENYGRQIIIDQKLLDDFIAKLPFQLTEAQLNATREILNDMSRPIHMNRLVQGDVGSGKTVVAAIAILAAVNDGMQAALMAPTEILATQHAKTISDLYQRAGIGMRIEILTSSTKKSVRKQLLEDLKSGQINLLIGTHSLIQEDVEFKNLGLAVIDEQHRFGVNQRAILRKQGQNPDILALTATPIPRTLAITAYGEMDVSSIKQLPKGRKPIKTFRGSMNEIDQIYKWVHQEVKQNGAQVYVVTPLVEESEKIEAQDSVATYEYIKNEYPDLRVGLLHGRVSPEEKQKTLSEFKNGQIDVLVSTTVVEVGVDAPEATIMIVLDADRFGLSTLHQLRGRVGRGEKQSYAVLVADPKTDYGQQRLDALVATTDGFELSQKDLELRGPGDIIGVKQSGMPDFKVGDPIKNLDVMEEAQRAAIDTISEPNWDSKPDNQVLVEYLSETMERYKDFD